MFLATVLALSSAVLHAGWNLLVKTSEDRRLALRGQFIAGGLWAVPFLAIVGWPGSDAVLELTTSSLIHLFYLAALAAAYQHGDFSLAYPTARGGGALLAALGGVILLDDRLAAVAWVAIGIVAIGLAMLTWTRTSRASVAWAAATAVTIASYTLVDSAGSRSAVSGASYGAALMVGIGTAAAALVTVTNGWGELLAARRSWGRWLVAGALQDAAYILVLVAVRHAPVGYVAILRESSVVLAALAGWVLLREQLGGRRLAASAVMLVGLVGLVWADLPT